MQEFMDKLDELAKLHDIAMRAVALAEAYNPIGKAYLVSKLHWIHQ